MCEVNLKNYIFNKLPPPKIILSKLYGCSSQTLPLSIETIHAARWRRLSWMSGQNELRKFPWRFCICISVKTIAYVTIEEKGNENNMWNLNANEHQVLGICFIRCKLASIRAWKDDQFIHILQSWKGKPIILIISKWFCKLVYYIYETLTYFAT